MSRCKNKYYICSVFYPSNSLIAINLSEKVLYPARPIDNLHMSKSKIKFLDKLNKSYDLYCKDKPFKFKSLIKKYFDLDNNYAESIDLIIKDSNSKVVLWQVQKPHYFLENKYILLFDQEDRFKRGTPYELVRGNKYYSIKLDQLDQLD